MMKVYASSGTSGLRRRYGTMSNYYRATGQAVIGATARTRGRPARIRPVRPRG